MARHKQGTQPHIRHRALARLVCLGSKLDGSWCSGLSSDPITYTTCSDSPPSDSAVIFRCSFLGPDFWPMVPQSEYSSDLGAQEAPFWLPFCSPFWVPISPKWWPKVSIVRIREPKRLHFGALFGSGCKSEN